MGISQAKSTYHDLPHLVEKFTLRSARKSEATRVGVVLCKMRARKRRGAHASSIHQGLVNTLYHLYALASPSYFSQLELPTLCWSRPSRPSQITKRQRAAGRGVRGPQGDSPRPRATRIQIKPFTHPTPLLPFHYPRSQLLASASQLGHRRDTGARARTQRPRWDRFAPARAAAPPLRPRRQLFACQRSCLGRPGVLERAGEGQAKSTA